MKGAPLQVLNASIFLAQLLAAIACFTVFIASQHEMRTEDGSVWFYWQHTYSTLLGGSDPRGLGMGNLNYGDPDSPAGSARGKCQGAGIVALLLNVIALPVLAVNLIFGILRVMSLPQAFLSKFMNPDRWRWVGREWGRCGCALGLQGLGIIVFGGACTAGSVSAIPQSKLVLTGMVFEILAWFLLLGATLAYKVVWDAIPDAYGEQNQEDASLDLEESENGVRHIDDAGMAAAARGGIDGGLTGVAIEDGKFHHPDSARPSAAPTSGAGAAATSPTLAQRKLITTEEALRMQAAQNAQGKLNLDHVLKMDESPSNAAAAGAGSGGNASSSRKSSLEEHAYDEASSIAGMREVNLMSPAQGQQGMGLNARPASAGLSPRPNSPQRKSSGLAIDIGRV